MLTEKLYCANENRTIKTDNDNNPEMLLLFVIH